MFLKNKLCCYVLLYSCWCHRLAVIDVIVTFSSHNTLMFCFVSAICELSCVLDIPLGAIGWL